jgi:hypothetical protein
MIFGARCRRRRVALDNVEQFARAALHRGLVALEELIMREKFPHQRHRRSLPPLLRPGPLPASAGADGPAAFGIALEPTPRRPPVEQLDKNCSKK